jgi:hypothetical protein
MDHLSNFLPSNEKLKNLKTVCGVPRTGYTKKTRKFENIENAFLGVGRT